MKQTTRSFYEERVQSAIDRIAEQLDEAIDLAALAKEAGMSAFHFHRVFRGMVGETAVELGRRLRLERAAWSLAQSTEAITQIAFAAGYETHEAFTRAFRARYAASPTEFRQRAVTEGCSRTQIQLAARCGVHYLTSASFVPFLEGSLVNVTITSFDALRVAAVRHVGPYHTISEAFGRLGRIAGPLFGTPGATMIALYHDDPDSTPADQLRSDAGVTVPEGTPLPEGVVEIRIPASRYAQYVHEGPYATLGDSWSRLLGHWLPASGHRLADRPSFEIYRNNPMTTPPEQLRTEIYAPLEE